MSLSMYHIREYMMSTYLIIGYVNLDHFVKLVSAKFLHSTVTIFSFVIYKYFGRGTGFSSSIVWTVFHPTCEVLTAVASVTASSPGLFFFF